MRNETLLKLSAVVFAVLWTLLMWWSRGPMDTVPLVVLALCGALAGGAVVLALRQVVPLVHRAALRLINSGSASPISPRTDLSCCCAADQKFQAGSNRSIADALAARPGVPEFLRVERAFRRSRDLVERNAEMPAQDHRQHVARHRVAPMHRGGEHRGQQFAARRGVVAGQHMGRIVRHGEADIERRRLAGKRIVVARIERRERMAERVLAAATASARKRAASAASGFFR